MPRIFCQHIHRTLNSKMLTFVILKNNYIYHHYFPIAPLLSHSHTSLILNQYSFSFDPRIFVFHSFEVIRNGFILPSRYVLFN